ncbi:hypothetical protein ASD47_19120 [Caulobacter sp. Root1472]|nr:hypothetical protein ASD47_19120 [Caulobacter sp. Root1472]
MGRPHRVEFDANLQTDLIHLEPQRRLARADLPIRSVDRRQSHYRLDREFGDLVFAQEAGILAL